MANIMNMVDVKNNPHRSGFDLSKRNCFTAKVGEILPVYKKYVLPGDSWEIDLREFARTQPLQTATYGRIRQYYDFYFVPFSLLWDKFDAFVVQTKNAYHAKDVLSAADVTSRHPYFTMSNLIGTINSIRDAGADKQYYDCILPSSADKANIATAQSLKLLSYLGYPIMSGVDAPAGLALSPWPLLAYQKIYQDFFRFSQWEDAAPWTYNLDYIMSDTQCEIDTSSLVTSSSLGKIPLMWTLRYANLDKDLFNGMLPSPQFGDTAIAGPLQANTNLSARWTSSQNVPGTLGAGLGVPVNSPAPATLQQLTSGKYILGTSDTGSFVQRSLSTTFSPTTDAFFPVDTSEMQLGLSILLLRQAEALQKWKEICISGDPDFKVQLEKHWGVKISDDLSYRCRYLGGIANNIDVSEVINTNFSGTEEVYQADIKGKGVSASQGKVKFKSHQYGIIMCVYHAKPIIDWNSSNILDPQMTAVSAADYPIPEFDQIGMQQLLRGNFVYDTPSNWEQPIGYVPRYADYKTDIDELHGAFDSHLFPNAGLAPWVLPHVLSVGQQTFTDVDYKVFKTPYNVCDNLFAVAADGNVSTDQLLCAAYFNIKCVRNLDRNGLPY